MKQIRFAVFLSLIAVFLFAGASRSEISWRTYRTEHFIIYHAPDHRSTAERAGRLAEKWHVILSQKFGFEPKTATPIYLYPDRVSFAESAGIHRSDRVVGLAQARTFRIKVDASGAFTDISNVIPHELVHVFISRKLREHFHEMPLWMHEGLAKYLSDDWSGQDAELLVDAVSGGEIMPLEKLESVFPRDERGRSVAYVQSYSAVKYMAEQYGPESITDLLTDMEGGQPFDSAFRYGTGKSLEEFEPEWRQYLWEEHRLSRLIRIATGIVSGAMVLFAVLAFRARLMQKRRRAREMEEEEQEFSWTDP